MTIIKRCIIWALTVESRLIIKKYKPFIIAVTGSVGKTGTKDAIFSALSSLPHVRKSEKSLNSEIGLPLTIIGVPNAWRSLSGWMANLRVGASFILKRQSYPNVLVLEIGADHPGDIKKVMKWLKPNIGVITKVGDKPVHVEFFKSPAQVFEEKASLVRAIKPGGTAVLFADEPKVIGLALELAEKGIKVVSFGLGEAADVKAANYVVSYVESNGFKVPTGFSFNVADSTISIKGVVGQVYMYPILAALAVAQAQGMDRALAVKNVNSYEAPKGRMNIITGKNDSTIIDDTYNSSPDAVVAALGALKGLDCTGKRIAALGDMMELGSYSAEQHRSIGKIASDYCDVLVTVGPRARAMADEAVSAGMVTENVLRYSASDEAAQALSSMIKAGDSILIKGSQSVRMERIVKALMADPSRASELLVRQEKEWLEKK
jgi:UDP-N-acetylmuramyl pentapeptide synthase